MHLALLAKAIRALRAGRIGDAAALKAAALTAPAYPDLERRLEQLAQPLPQIDLAVLGALDRGTLGHAYAAFMRLNKLKPLTASATLAATLGTRNVLAVRYAMLHDAFHVLLGFDTSLPGELGVWSFVAGQRYSPSYDYAARLACIVYPIVAPSKLGALRAARLHGLAMAHEVACLIAQPIEQFWDEPLSAIRRRLSIRPQSVT